MTHKNGGRFRASCEPIPGVSPVFVPLSPGTYRPARRVSSTAAGRLASQRLSVMLPATSGVTPSVAGSCAPGALANGGVDRPRAAAHPEHGPRVWASAEAPPDRPAPASFPRAEPARPVVLRPSVANVETELGASEPYRSTFVNTAPLIWLLRGPSTLVHRTLADHTDRVRRVSSARQRGCTTGPNRGPPLLPRRAALLSELADAPVGWSVVTPVPSVGPPERPLRRAAPGTEPGVPPP